MADRNRFVEGMTAGVLMMFAADGLHWFITPMSHPNATSFQTGWVVAQVLVGTIGVTWLIVRNRAAKTAAPAR